jgi:hypothetical protein
MARPPVSLMLFNDARITSDSSQPNFHKVRASLEIKDGPFERATLVVDLRSTCYPFESRASNKPPAGHRWPADCDAFDRNFEISLDDEPGPGIELMRAITPFGGPLHLEIDVTDVMNGAPGKHTAQVLIPTWSDGAGQVSGSAGGWNVTVKLELQPGTPPRKVLAVVPLFNLSHGKSTTPPIAKIDTPAGATSVRLEYRATGHGGANDTTSGECIGPAEEFCTRTHHLLTMMLATVDDSFTFASSSVL